MQQNLQKFVRLCGNMLLPCFLFVLGLFVYLLANDLNYSDGVVFYRVFLITNVILLLVLLNFNQGKTLFFAGVIFLSCLGVNYLKKISGIELKETDIYRNISVLLPLNLWFFYLKYPRRFLSRITLLCLTLIIFEYIALEFLSRHNVSLSYNLFGVNVFSLAAFVWLLGTALWNSVKTGKLYDYSIFFAGLSVAMAFYFCYNPVALSLFFLSASLIICSMVICNLVRNYYYDEQTDLYNRSSYLRHSRYFPPKYSLGIISIDGFDGLKKGLTSRQKNELIWLSADIIQEYLPEEAVLYRYDEDKFLAFCEKMTLKEVKSCLEVIRRRIAGIEFILFHHPIPVKITISGGVAEKKRVDVNADEVLQRAEKAMYETLKFTGNVISPVIKNERR